MTARFFLVALFAIVIIPAASRAQTPLARESLGSGLGTSVFLTHAPGDTTGVFVVEQAGRIRVFRAGQPPKVFLDMRSLVAAGGEQGLLGLAFHPRFAETGYFYVKYNKSAATNPNANMVARYQVGSDPDVADAASHAVVLRCSNGGGNHNAGWIGFGPDGYLYITQGNNAGNPQDPNSFGGKVLRIDVDGDDFPADDQRNYALPPDNPFVGRDGADEVWAWGLRNPWRASFDRDSGDLWIADVGGSTREEITRLPAGADGLNLGYPCLEGFHCFSSCQDCTAPLYTPPVHDYPRATGGCIIGGFVYRGCAIPDLRGAYVFADRTVQDVWSFRYDGTAISDFRDLSSALGVSGITSFGEDADGELYICASSGVYKIVPSTVPPTSCPPLGDLNCDGAINFVDVDPFLAALLAPADYHRDYATCFRRLADLDESGRIDFLDIDPFVACLFDAVCP